MKRKKDKQSTTEVMIDAVAQAKLANMAKLVPGSDGEKTSAEAIKSLMEAKAKSEEAASNKKDAKQKWMDRAFRAAEIVAPVVLTLGGLWFGYKFEMTDETTTSPTFREFRNKSNLYGMFKRK